jgi:hypothetical protein
MESSQTLNELGQRSADAQQAATPLERLDQALKAGAELSQVAARHGTRSRLCPQCWSRPGRPCTVAGPDGDHLARYLDAERAGVIGREQLAEVVGSLEVVASHVIVRDGAADDGETCPRCGAINWGMTPDGRNECVSCGYVDDAS